MSNFTLYNYFRSSTSYRARIAFNIKGLEYDYKAVHLLKDGGQQNLDEYRKLNPQGEVPTLIHDGKTIGQSVAIIEYIDEIHPFPPLFPNDLYLKAKVRQFCENINSFMHPVSNLKVMQKLEKEHGFTEAQKLEWIQHWYSQGFKSLEKMLEEFSGEYCFENAITAADVFLIPVIFSAQRFKVDLNPYEHCRTINERCLQLEEFRKAHPYRQPDTPEAEKIP